MTRLPLVVLAAAGLGLATPAAAQTKIDFGNDSSQWANDGECDDPRFIGEGMAPVYTTENTSRDASDCRAAFQAGTIRLREPGAAGGNLVVDGVEFGDDSGQWANDGECDDPRFAGEGMAVVTNDSMARRDATDCSTAFQAGRIRLADAGNSPASPAKAPAAPAPGGSAAEIDFGDDSSQWANDGECDDPRFQGEGMAAIYSADNTSRDASDCRAAFQAGTIRLRESVPAGQSLTIDGINFGDDSGAWPNDGECDDPRFQGEGMAVILLDEDSRRDASDCAEGYRAGRLTLRSGASRN